MHLTRPRSPVADMPIERGRHPEPSYGEVRSSSRIEGVRVPVYLCVGSYILFVAAAMVNSVMLFASVAWRLPVFRRSAQHRDSSDQSCTCVSAAYGTAERVPRGNGRGQSGAGPMAQEQCVGAHSGNEVPCGPLRQRGAARTSAGNVAAATGALRLSCRGPAPRRGSCAR